MIEPSLYMKRDPAYSLAGRFEVIVDKSVKPGPGVYYPEKVIDIRCRTAWSYIANCMISCKSVTEVIINLIIWMDTTGRDSWIQGAQSLCKKCVKHIGMIGNLSAAMEIN